MGSRPMNQEAEHAVPEVWGRSWEVQGRQSQVCARSSRASPTSEALHVLFNDPCVCLITREMVTLLNNHHDFDHNGYVSLQL